MAWIKDKLMNRKIEGESSFDSLEPLAEKLSIDSESQDFVLDGSLRLNEFKTNPVDSKQVLISGGSIDLGDSDSHIIISNNNGNADIDGDLDVHGDGDFAGDVTAKTLNQSEVNWSTPITLRGHNGGADYQAEMTFGRCCIINNVMHIVVIVKCENVGESTISHPTATFSNITVPAEIGAKIYDLDGKNLNETPLTSNCPITSSTRSGCGTASEWSETYSDLGIINSKLCRTANLNEMVIRRRESLPTLGAGQVGYSLIGFELVLL